MAGKPNTNIPQFTTVGDPESQTIKDAAARHSFDKGAKTNDALNPVPRATGMVPEKPTRAREQF